MFRETDGGTKISVRTREGGCDATMLTAKYGGGGHARAAGATLDLPLDEAVTAVLREARAMLAASGG